MRALKYIKSMDIKCCVCDNKVLQSFESEHLSSYVCKYKCTYMSTGSCLTKNMRTTLYFSVNLKKLNNLVCSAVSLFDNNYKNLYSTQLYLKNNSIIECNLNIINMSQNKIQSFAKSQIIL